MASVFRCIDARDWRAVGSARALIEKVAVAGQSWLKGIGSARLLAIHLAPDRRPL
jgi:hypothetical protein